MWRLIPNCTLKKTSYYLNVGPLKAAHKNLELLEMCKVNVFRGSLQVLALVVMKWQIKLFQV